ncbi:hypothetical protein BJ912DRAFT_924626 [Pholiota molesta]|nr:hypothetical protein BJ912DRAFT_924626 [Pholiota molesta]
MTTSTFARKSRTERRQISIFTVMFTFNRVVGTDDWHIIASSSCASYGDLLFPKTDGEENYIQYTFKNGISTARVERALSAIVALSALGNLLSVIFNQGHESGTRTYVILPFGKVWESNRSFSAPFAGLALPLPPGDAVPPPPLLRALAFIHLSFQRSNAAVCFGSVYLPFFPYPVAREPALAPRRLLLRRSQSPPCYLTDMIAAGGCVVCETSGLGEMPIHIPPATTAPSLVESRTTTLASFAPVQA